MTGGTGTSRTCRPCCARRTRPARTARRGSSSGGCSSSPSRPDAAPPTQLGPGDAGRALHHRVIDELPVEATKLLVALTAGGGAQHVSRGDTQQKRPHLDPPPSTRPGYVGTPVAS